MSLKILIVGSLIGCALVACSTGPSASNCYGSGRPGCEPYWKDGSPKTVVVEAEITDDFVRKFKIPDKQKYINRGGVIPAKRWRRSGGSELEARKAVLECGGGIYDGRNGLELMKILPLTQYNDGLVLVKKCMQNDGFEYLGKFDPCALDTSLSACQSGSVIPIRNLITRIDGVYCVDIPTVPECQPQTVERRLNSVFCKQYPRAQVCQPSGQEAVPKTEDTTSKTIAPTSSGGAK